MGIFKGQRPRFGFGARLEYLDAEGVGHVALQGTAEVLPARRARVRESHWVFVCVSEREGGIEGDRKGER